MASEVHCPLCGYLCKQRKHPKHSGYGPSAEIELMNHLEQFHQREIQERLERGSHSSVRE